MPILYILYCLAECAGMKLVNVTQIKPLFEHPPSFWFIPSLRQLPQGLTKSLGANRLMSIGALNPLPLGAGRPWAGRETLVNEVVTVCGLPPLRHAQRC